VQDKKLMQEVKKAHEQGIKGSTGWQYAWKEDEAKKLVLRTHTTCLSVQTLMDIAKRKEFPAKYFALGKCFRNETVDWSHSFEFNQTEGIVVDEKANFKQLLGYLKEFFRKMGYEKLRIRPGYFPYTEPSLEIDVFHPVHKKWVELGGAGMFRPEVTIPIFGKHIPVLAWGPGFDRIIMEYYNITDLREMYKNDLTTLREMKVWRR
jgi:phenylalanyl-tRNA synthetase alpha chain